MFNPLEKLMEALRKRTEQAKTVASNVGNRISSNAQWVGNQAQQNIAKPAQQAIQATPSRVSNNLQWAGKQAQKNIQQAQSQILSPQNVNAFQRGVLKFPAMAQNSIAQAAKSPYPLQSFIPKKIMTAAPEVAKYFDQRQTPVLLSKQGLGQYAKALGRTFDPVSDVALAPYVGAKTFLGSAAIGSAFNTGAQVMSNVANKKSLTTDLGKAASIGAQHGIVQSPKISAITGGVTNPVIQKISAKVLQQFPKLSPVGMQIINRIVQGTLSIPEGKAIAKATGQDYNVTSAAIDFAVGAGIAPKVGKMLGDNVGLQAKPTGDIMEANYSKILPGESPTEYIARIKNKKPVVGGGIDAIWNNDPTLKARIDKAFSTGDTATVEKLLPQVPEQNRAYYQALKTNPLDDLMSEAKKTDQVMFEYDNAGAIYKGSDGKTYLKDKKGKFIDITDTGIKTIEDIYKKANPTTNVDPLLTEAKKYKIDFPDSTDNPLYSSMKKTQDDMMKYIDENISKKRYKTDADIPKQIKQKADDLKSIWQGEWKKWQDVYVNQANTAPVASEAKLTPNLKVTDAYGQTNMGYSIKNMEKRANETGYNLYDALIKKVDSQTTVEGKRLGMESIMDDLWGKANTAPVGKGVNAPEAKKSADMLRSELESLRKQQSKVDTWFELNGGKYGKGTREKEMSIVQGEIKMKIKAIQDSLSILNKANTGMSGSQSRKVMEQDATKQSIQQKVVPKSNIVSETSASGSSIPPKPQDVAATLPKRVDDFIQKTLGYSTENPTGGTREAGAYTKTLRKGQEAITKKVEAGLGSENKYIRNAASTLQGFFRGLGMSPERANASMELRGSMGVANERAYNVMGSLYKSLDNNKVSLERINAVLDPELAKTKVTFDQLSTTEKQAYGIIREGLDIVHDTSYANGHISSELYTKNKGKYTPRLYDVMEMPPEVNKFVTQGKKIVNDLYKQRKGLDEWKVENSLNDPVYGLGKRLAQVETNTAIKKYTDFLSSTPRFISDVEKPGFTKLSDSPAYGSLSGKYVLNSAAEDLKGHFFSSQAMQNLYDVFRAYDRLPVRQLQKKLLTVFNPTTNVGNIVSDQVFGFVTGVDPLTLNKNLLELKSNPSSYKKISDYLMRKGIVGTDITRTDFVDKLGQIDDLAMGKKQNIVSKVAGNIQEFYGGTDDVYKASAFKSLLDKGFTLEEATRKVADGFQNYANVGKFYDVWSKTPIVGSTFIKFQGDLLRIIKNGAVNNPLGLISFLGILQGISLLTSKLSGEKPEDYKTRTERFAAPMIPGLNIPLTWQTPWGEINAARYISPFFANNETTNLGKMLPFVPNIDTKKDVASNIAMNANDPLLSTPVQLAVNRDFRGKPISDPNENKYQPSTLTRGEKLVNQAKFTGRAYLPPPVNSAIDVASVASGGTNMYGQKQTVPQSIARLGGIKVTQFGADEAKATREKDAYFDNKGDESVKSLIGSVVESQIRGDITQEQADARVKELSKKLSTPIDNVKMGEIKYTQQKQVSDEHKKEAIDAYLSGDKEGAKAIRDQYKLKISKDDIKFQTTTQKNKAIEAYLDGDKEGAKAMRDKYGLKIAKKDINAKAKSRAIVLYKKGKTLGDQSLIDEAKTIRDKYGLKISQKDLD